MTWSPREPRPAPHVEIETASPLWQAEPVAGEAVRDALAAAAAQAPAAGEVSVLLADDMTVKRLNAKWRGIDKPTNVLSFPAAKDTGLLGDIAFAFETVKREADVEGKPFLHHLSHLTVHGFLHLLGYDHETDSQAQAMESLERRVLAQLEIPDPYPRNA